MGGSVSTSIKNVFNKINPWAEEEIDMRVPESMLKEKPYLRFLERKEWTDTKPKWRRRLKTPVDRYLIRYTTNTPDCEEDEECVDLLNKLRETHISYGLPDIAYNFLVAKDGTVYEGRGWTDKPTKMDYKSMEHHGKSIDIAVFGNWMDLYLPAAVDSAVCRLMQKGVELGYARSGFDVIEVREDTSLETGNTGHWSREEMENDLDEKIYDSPEPESPADS